MNDYGRPVRDDYEDWRDSVERDWERRERLERVDEAHAKGDKDLTAEWWPPKEVRDDDR